MCLPLSEHLKLTIWNSYNSQGSLRGMDSACRRGVVMGRVWRAESPGSPLCLRIRTTA